MISMELPPTVHIQHLNHGHGLTSLQSHNHHNNQHHHHHHHTSGLMQHQHQTCLTNMQNDDKQKSELRLMMLCII